MKKKYVLILFLIIFLFFLGDFALAVKLEVLPNEIKDIPSLIGYFFTFLMGIVGLLAILILVVGAFRYLTSAGNPEIMAEARKKMFFSIIGLVLLLSSFLILKTINPQLVEQTKITPLRGVPGLFFQGANVPNKSAPLSVGDIEKTTSAGYKTIAYTCKTESGNELPEKPILLVFFYPETEMEGDKNSVFVQELHCGGSAPLDTGKSYEIRIKTPGIYVYFDSGCNANSYRSQAFTSNQTDLGELAGKTGCVEIINKVDNPDDKTKNTYYGVILHLSKNFIGRCGTGVIFEDADSLKIKADIPAASMTVFQWQPSWKNAGNGVVFYSHPYSDFRGGGFYDASPLKLEKQSPYFEGNTAMFNFNYSQSGVLPIERSMCRTFAQCPGSIKFFGDYNVVLYTGRNCQVFNNDVENLKIEWITTGGKPSLVRIIPVK